MTTLIFSIVKSAACFSLLFGIYWFFLRSETWFQFNRIYLLLIAGCSALAPWIPIRGFGEKTPQFISVILSPLTVSPVRIENQSHNFDLFFILNAVYLAGSVILLLRVIARCLRITALIRKCHAIRINGLRVVKMSRSTTPFSFFHFIFLPEAGFSNEESETILAHETVHVNQGHSLDILFIELFTAFQWFNPLTWLFAREMRLLHEYLADDLLIRKGIKKSLYQQLILETVLSERVSALANHFNVSQLKNRIVMMSKTKPGTGSKVKMMSVLPITLLALFFFTANSLKISAFPQDSGKEKAKTEQKQEPMKAVEVMPSFPGGDQARVKFMQENLSFPAEAMKKNITGKVFVNFVVKADGSIDQVKVLKGIGGGCDEEAVRVIKMMPKWKPGMNKGKPVDVQFTMPIQFTLDGKKDDKAPMPEKQKK